VSAVLPAALNLPPRTVFGAGASAAVLNECVSLGRRGLIVHGRSAQRSGALQRILDRCPAGAQAATWCHPGGEPGLQQLESLLRDARAERPDWVVGFGGGSVLDMSKACAGLLRAPCGVVEYHNGARIPDASVPFVAVPTTAGTGSEATTVCVLTNESTREKKSFRHPSFMARLVVLDPGLLCGSPPEVIASAGMDAFVQAVESFLSSGSTWLTEAMSLKAAALVASNLEAAWRGGQGDCLSDLMTGSYLAGVALSHARLGLVHGLAHPLGARYGIPHGYLCAACLPAVLEFNRPACCEKFERLSGALGVDVAVRTRQLLEAVGVPAVLAGWRLEDQDGIVRETLASGSTAANPRDVEDGDVRRILDGLFCAVHARA
jgi:alcohol dehydrogenase class IV